VTHVTAVSDYLIAVVLILVTATATVAALTRDPVRQALVLAMLGMTLALLFALLQAPDVALSQLAVGTAVTPLLILLTVRKVRHEKDAKNAKDAKEKGGGDR
jgi:uncharacterized MnhB-related membrane protein